MTNRNFWEALAIIIFSIFMGFVAFALTQSIFDLIFVPLVVFLLWYYDMKVGELDKRLSEMESRLSKNSAKTPNSS